MMKKMKGVVSVGSTSYAVFEDQRTWLRHQSLLQDYEDLQKDTNAMRMILQAAKQKKMILSAEVRFLRQRYRYLVKNPSPKPSKPRKPQPKPDISQPLKAKIQAHVSKGRNYSRKDSTLRPPMASHFNPNERISNGFETTSRKTGHMFDLNQNARSLSRTDPSPPSSAAALDVNHKDMIQSGKEAMGRCTIPFFDLNQISREEEELPGDTEPTNIEDQKRNSRRGVSEELHNDIKLLACRNLGNGSTKTVKRKISGLDQVALRV